MTTQTVPQDRALVTRRDRADVITTAIESRAQALMEVMPEGMDHRRFLRATLTAITRNPDLLACTPESLILAVFEAAEIGMVPTGSLNRAWIIPQRRNVAEKGQPKRYVTEAELRIGYQGLTDLTRQGDVRSVESRAVFSGDEFAVTYGTDPGITHVPSFDGAMTPEMLTHVYAIAVLKDGARIFEVMTKAQVDAIRARAPGSNYGPWVTDYVQMARKTVIRRLCNYLPLTPQAQAAIIRDDEREMRPVPQVTEGRSDATEQARAKLKAKLGVEIEGEVVSVDPADEQENEDALIEELGDLLDGAK